MKWPFGKNQSVGIAIFVSVFVAALWRISDETVLANFLMWFGPAGIIGILFPGAFVNVAKHKRASDVDED